MIKKLKQIRKQKKITQAIAAEHLGITPATLWYYETEKRKIPLCIAIEYADYLGYRVEMLLK